MGRIVRSPVQVQRKQLARPQLEPGQLQADQPGMEATDDAHPPESEHSATEPGDDYLTRIAKYIPAEIVAFFIFVNAIVSDALTKAMSAIEASNPLETQSSLLSAALRQTNLAGIQLIWIAWGVLAVSFVMIPFYLISMKDPNEEGESVSLNIVMSLLAFPVWAYAVDAVAFRTFHDGALASIILATFSIISGVVSPSGLQQIKTFLGIGKTATDHSNAGI